MRAATLAGLVVIACALAVICASPGVAGAKVPQGFVGVVVGSPLSPSTVSSTAMSSQFDLMVAAGVQSIHVVFDWSGAQPYQSWSDVPADQAAQFESVGGVPTRFAATDQIVGLAAQHGITILPEILYAPSWDGIANPKGGIERPQRVGPLADYVGALVRRYGPRGTFWAGQPRKVPIHMWQIWNEPNITWFWSEQPFQRSYVSLLRAAHNAIKRADHGAKIVLAGMPNFSWLSLRGIYKIRGARGLFDVVAAHPYTVRPSGVITILERIRQVMDKAGDRRKPIIADEVSWPSSKGEAKHSFGYAIGTTEAGQARKVSEILPLLGASRQRLGLLSFDWFDWDGIEDPSLSLFGYSGLERFSPAGFVAKPALAAFRHAALVLEGCRRKGSLSTSCLR